MRHEMQWQVISFNRPTFCLFRGNVTVECREITEVYAEPCQISKMECFKCLAGFWIHLWITALSKEAKWRLKEASKLPFSTDLPMVLIFILFFCNLLYGAFCQNSYRLKVANCFCTKALRLWKNSSDSFQHVS